MKRRNESEPETSVIAKKKPANKKAADVSTEKEEESASKREHQRGGRGRHRTKRVYGLIREQMEFYFSDANLAKSKFMQSKMEENEERWVKLDVFLTFNKIIELLNNHFEGQCRTEDLVKALTKAPSDMLQLERSESGEYRIRRTTQLRSKSASETDSCTIYVERLPRFATIEMLSRLFEETAGPVDYVSLPRFKSNGEIKGFAFVQFREQQAVDKALEAFGVVQHEDPGNLASIQAYKEENEGGEKKATMAKDEEAEIGELEGPQVKDGVSEEQKKKSVVTKDDGHKKEKKKKKKGSVNDNKVQEGHADNIAEVGDSDTNDEVVDSDKNDEGGCDGKNDKSEDDSGKEDEEKGVNRNRRRRRSHVLSSSTTLLMSLQIMTKQSWKRLRNQYLNTQRHNVAECKRRLQQWNRRNEPQTSTTTTTTMPTTVEPGTIIKFSLSTPIQDKHKVRMMVQSAYVDPVAYVDVEEGSSVYYVRCNSKDQASKLANLSLLGKGIVLQGEEETKYFDRMAKQREKHKEERVKRKEPRGRDKLKSKLQKNSHKYFDLDDDN